MKNFKKLICILITAALAVTFAFALVACNKDPKPTEMTQADFDELEGYRLATMDYVSCRFVVTTVTTTDTGTVTEEKTVGFYYNSADRDRTLTIDTVLTDEAGNVTRTYYLAGNPSGSTMIEAEAVYEGDSTTPVSSEYNRSARDLVISRVFETSGAQDAVNEILNAKNDYDVASAQVTKRGDNDKDYTIKYEDAESGKSMTISTIVRNGMFASVTVTKGNVTYTTTYEHTDERLSPATYAAWFETHPAPED